MIFPSDLSEAALWENLAEEAVELAHEAQKLARVLRGDNPTGVEVPIERMARINNIYEEWADLDNVARVLNLKVDDHYAEWKMKRWIARLNAPTCEQCCPKYTECNKEESVNNDSGK